jgi:ATP-dependent DNA helicase RecG
VNYDLMLHKIAAGEDSTRQFKRDIRNAPSLAAEIAAFANAAGGTIFIGVTDDGRAEGLESADVGRVNQLISNAASHLVRSPVTVTTENVVIENGRVVIVLTVPQGLDKPYFDNNGVIWLKTGADKRRVNTKEELRRFFQVTEHFYADELPTRGTIRDLDMLRLRDFLLGAYDRNLPENDEELTTLLRNLNLALASGQLNLAGLLLLGRAPQRYQPQFTLKAVSFPGEDIHPTTYLDSEDFEGPLPAIFEGAMAFVVRNLHKVQGSGGVNAPGRPEIPRIVFEELIVNALVHRDYLVSAPIRLFLYDDRVEITSPGHLPNNLTVESIRAGIANIRNPVIVSVASKGLLPYHGLGSGIRRAIAAWREIEFVDDRERNQFCAVVRRPAWQGDAVAEPTRTLRPGRAEPGDELLKILRVRPYANYDELAEYLGVSVATVKRRLQSLKQDGRVRRVGSRKTGHWEVIA